MARIETAARCLDFVAWRLAISPPNLSKALKNDILAMIGTLGQDLLLVNSACLYIEINRMTPADYVTAYNLASDKSTLLPTWDYDYIAEWESRP